MPAYTCPHCEQSFTASAPIAPTKVLCPHCRQTVHLPAASVARWFIARNKKKLGPYTWQQLETLAERGELLPDEMLLQEGTKQWVRATTLPALFESVEMAPRKKPTSRRSFPWLLAGLAGAGTFVLVSIGVLVVLIYFWNDTPIEPTPVTPVLISETKKKNEPPDEPKKEKGAPKKELKKEEKKKATEVRADDGVEKLVERLNWHRKAAGLGFATLDVELSAGCLAHAKYLAKNLDPSKADALNVYAEDAKKPGYSVDGERAGKVAMVSFVEPTAALERWIGRLVSRVSLLSPEMQSIGVGVSRNERGDWFCVVDAQRGRGDPIVAFPAPMQSDVPISFSGGTDVPDAKAAAGFPISVTFSPTKQVTDAQIELRDPKGNTVEGWTWTPEMPLHPGTKVNAIGLIPKALLQANSAYQVKASAKIDGKPWNLTWSFTTEDGADNKGFWAQKAVAKVNFYRAAAGLKAVILDDALSKACLSHARYLVLNEGHPSLVGLKAHEEDPTLPGYSKEGYDAGKASDIGIGDYEPIDAVDAWMATLYHRVPILEPNLKSIGFGCARGRRQGWATVMNVQTGRDKTSRSQAVFYPAPDQIDVPVSFPNSGEEPNPIPEDKDGRAGYPITAFFPAMEPLKNATGKLTNNKGDEVPAWLSSPEKPANPNFARSQGTAVCLIAKDPLAPKSIYHVQFQGTLGGKAWQKKWQFTTRDAGLDSEEATRAVIDRLNHFRVHAGLNAVALDPVLTRGCQLHAEYLVKNADALLKSNAPVNDEDAELPWFTVDGLRAARQSLIFTNAPTPAMQIDDLMATFTSRVFLLAPNLQRIGYGCSHDIGRGWRCVLDPNGGRGDSRIVVYPAAKQVDVPLLGFDRIDEVQGKLGFPITVTFPQRSIVRNVQAVLSDAEKKDVEIWISSPEKPLHDKLQRATIGVHPLEALHAGRTYSVTVSAIVDGKEWRQSWQFTTAK